MDANPYEITLPDYVLVHPDLTNDPEGKQGQVGFITAAIWNTDEFYVGFDDGVVGLYAANALLMHKDPRDIYHPLLRSALIASAPVIDGPDFKMLYKIARMLECEVPQSQQRALMLAGKNANIRDYALTSIEAAINLNREQSRRL